MAARLPPLAARLLHQSWLLRIPNPYLTLRTQTAPLRLHSTLRASRPRPSNASTPSRLPRAPRRPYSDPSAPPDPHKLAPIPPPPPPAQSFSQRMRSLSREYGWSAVGVYFALSALDFPFCFLAVKVIGTERIGHAEKIVVGAFWRGVERVAPGFAESSRKVVLGEEGAAAAVAGREGWGVEEAQKANSGEDPSLWTQLALAYAIHKSFIFIRVPLTAAVLPKVVKTLRGWGWNIGKRKPKTVQAPK